MNGTLIIGGDVSASWQRITLLQVRKKGIQDMRPLAFWMIISTDSGSALYLMGTKPLAWSLHADTKKGQNASEWSPPSPEKIFDVGTFKTNTDTTAIGRRRTNYIDITESHITVKSTVSSTGSSGLPHRAHQRPESLALCEGNPTVTGGFPSQMAGTCRWLSARLQ